MCDFYIHVYRLDGQAYALIQNLQLWKDWSTLIEQSATLVTDCSIRVYQFLKQGL